MTCKKQNAFKKCCALQIQAIWKQSKDAMNVIRYSGNRGKCGRFIGLTQTTDEQATEFLNQFGLEYKNYRKQ